YYDDNNDNDSDNDMDDVDDVDGVERTMVVPERDVLMGQWAGFEVANEGAEGRSPTPPGMLRVRSILPPPRRRTRANNSADGKHSTTGQPKAQRRLRAVRFTSLPVGVLGRVMEHLPVDTMLALTNSCRVLRRVVHRHGPRQSLALAGADAFTAVGLQMWRARVQQLGWRLWRERRRGRERRLRVWVPRSHLLLLERICGVRGEAAVLGLVAGEPDLVFKAVFDDLIADYSAFGTCARSVPGLVHGCGGVRGARAVAERLDQLLWFARGRFTRDADAANARLVAAADRFEAEYRAQFTRAFLQGDCARMQGCAHVLAGIRDGRACTRVLVDAHPLFAGGGGACAAVLALGARATDAHS
ncbi:hypothetical protein GGF43_006611, partial [Coemansia sp. RSA 2618]